MSIYEQCPTYTGKVVALEKTNKNHLEDLLKCYSDTLAVSLFNSDNCNGDTFYYTTPQRMAQAIDFWEYSYQERYFVRLTVIDKVSGECVGTLEMFKGTEKTVVDSYGLLRIDLRSDYETTRVINDILSMVTENLLSAFDVEHIITKAIPKAEVRVACLKKNGYAPINEKYMTYDNYFVR
ncbi:MAG TPA: N-acetyltransferase [Clostridiales bacterium]|nr:N-acetyltransferase [Clostridiales bacterium]